MKIDSSLGFTVVVKNNTLQFPFSDEVLKAIDILEELPSKERIAWEKKIGFTSYQTLYEKIEKQLNNIDNEKEYDKLIQSNSLIIKKDPNGYLGIKPRIYGSYSYITNSLGFFINEIFANKVYDGVLYSGYIYDLPAIIAKSHENTSDINFDLSKFEIQTIVLDNNESSPLKSYVDREKTNNQGVCLRIGDDSNRKKWKKKASFKMGIENNYIPTTISSIEDWNKTYYTVYYYCNYDPYNYDCDCYTCECGYSGYYSSELGKWLTYTEDNSGYWKVEVPYEGYFEDAPWNKPPEGMFSQYITEIHQKRYYNWEGNVKVWVQFYAEILKWWSWKTYDGTILRIDNIEATVLIGENDPGHSDILTTTINPISWNQENNEGTHIHSKIYQKTYDFIIPGYEKINKPYARFDCYSGELEVRFCSIHPITFSY
jgi:hypothetical protein